MRGVTYAIRRALTLSMPLVINLSFGNCYGAHDGASLLERFLDNAAEIGRTVICVGNGNEGNSAGHTAGNVRERKVIELAVASFERSLSIQLWKQYSDQYRHLSDRTEWKLPRAVCAKRKDGLFLRADENIGL